MFVSIVVTALILNGVFAVLGIVPKSSKAISELTQFKADFSLCIALFEYVQGRFMVFAKSERPFSFFKKDHPHTARTVKRTISKSQNRRFSPPLINQLFLR
jgi:hypothetical protein